jgi:hypothetical protein
MTRKLYSVADVCHLLGWDSREQYLYSRVRAAIMAGAAGFPSRCGRGWALTQAQARQLINHLRQRWPDGETRDPRGHRKEAVAAAQ